jgi:hypothetical protein
MKASEIVAEVERLAATAVDSGDYTEADILAIINRGRLIIAGGGDRPYGKPKLAPLPGLLTTGTVTVSADSNTVSVPATYQRGLLWVKGGEKLKRHESLQDLLNRYEGEVGTPTAYCLKGRTLWLAPTPTSDTTLTLYFHERPTDLSISAGPPAVDSEPDELPEELHHKLLVSYTCREIFAESESGLEVGRPDTARYDRIFNDALDELDRAIGPEEQEPQNVTDDYLTEDNIW